MYVPMNPRQFRRRFRTERDCVRYVVRSKWPEGFQCPRCSHQGFSLIQRRHLYQCKRCGHQTSVTANTIFHKTRKPLRDWFWAIFLVATRTTGSSARQLQHDLGISYPTAWSWCHKIRKAMEDRDTHYTLRGLVEVDDAYIGGKKKPGKRGRGASGKVPVMVAVESRVEGCGHVALTKLGRLCASDARQFLDRKLRGDAQVVCDGLSIYGPLSDSFHLTQIPVGEGRRAVEIFPDVHRVIARLKNWIRGTHCHVSDKHLNRYLAEFGYRFNRRFAQRRATIFDRLVKACCATPTITYRQLVADLT